MNLKTVEKAAQPDVIQPDSGWCALARKLWDDVLSTYHLESHHRQLLRQACHALDVAEGARRVTEKEGRFLWTGAPPKEKLIANPALEVERKARDSFRMCLKELGLDIAKGGH
jgi:hypothetical protein